jgi:hypothetical protein
MSSRNKMLITIFVVLIITFILYINCSTPEPLDKLPTSVKKITNSSTTTISSSLISFTPDTRVVAPNIMYSPNSFTISNNGDNNNTTLVVVNYPVNKGSVYQLSLDLVTQNMENTITLVSTGDVCLLPSNCMFVLDDLKTPVVNNIITTPKNSYNKYIFNVKWTSSKFKLFTLTFKFPNNGESIMIDAMNITKLK